MKTEIIEYKGKYYPTVMIGSLRFGITNELAMWGAPASIIKYCSHRSEKKAQETLDGYMKFSRGEEDNDTEI